MLAMNARFSGENWVPRTHRAPETDYMFGFTVRHTPPQRIYVWVHGATQPTQWIYVWVYSATHPALRAPLSERGWRGSDLLIIKTIRQPIPSRRGVAVGRGVSHHQTPTIPWCVAPSNTDNPGGCRIVKLAICRIRSIRGRFGFLFFQWLCGDNEHNCKFFYAIQLFCVHLQFQP